MREFDQLKAYVKPLACYPGTPTGNLTNPEIGDAGNVIQIYFQNGWEGRYLRYPAPPGSPAGWTSAGFVFLEAMHVTQVEWSPFRRQQIAVLPISQNIAEGSLPQIFFTGGLPATVNGGPYPVMEGAHLNRLDMWTTIKPSFENLRNLVFSGMLPGCEPGFPQPFPNGSRLFRIVGSDNTVNTQPNQQGAIRMDQIISGRYRQFSSGVTTTARSGQGYQSLIPLVHDNQFGGNPGLSEKIYHISFIVSIASTIQSVDQWLPPVGGTVTANNHLFSGFQIPSLVDSLTIGLESIESDAEFGTLVARSATRTNYAG